MMMKFTNYIFKLSYTRVSNNSVNYVNTFVLRALKNIGNQSTRMMNNNAQLSNDY